MGLDYTFFFRILKYIIINSKILFYFSIKLLENKYIYIIDFIFLFFENRILKIYMKLIFIF